MQDRIVYRCYRFLSLSGMLGLGLLAGKGHAQSTNRYVVHPDNLPDGWTPDTQYLTWQTAATNIQDAVTKAVGAVGDYVGDTVVVTDGVFRSTANPVVNIAKTIRVRSVNGPEFTSIDGGGTSRCVQISLNGTLDGFTIAHGSTNKYGAGVYNSANAPLISNCVIVANTVSGAASLSEPGAGLFIKGATVRNCLIISNLYQCTGTLGGGGGIGFQAAGLLADSTVRANSSTVQDGGGVYGYQGGAVSNCLIADNSALSEGGGIFWYGNATDARRISGCIISNNSAAVGGGLYLQFTPNYVENCTIVDNVATSSTGGGLYATLLSGNQRLEVINSKIVGNSSSGNGSGIYVTTRYTTTVAVLRNVLIARNGNQSGLYMVNNATDRTRMMIHNATVISNAPYGLYVAYDHDILNSIVYGNISADIQWLSGGSEANSVFHSCFGASSLVNNNINGDPNLVNAGAGDYRLASGSPCINTGTNLSWMSEPGAVDLDGRPRLDRFTRLPDMGAYEYVAPGSLIQLR